MCLSTVYSGNEINDENLLCEYVTEINVHDNFVQLFDITGASKEYKGIVNKIDLVKNVIFVNLD